MKILQILPELNVGGVERGTVDLARHLVLRGHASLVISNGGSLVKSLEEAGSRHIQLPVHKKNILTMIYCIQELQKIIRREGIEIVHARSRVPAWIAYFASRSTDAEFLTTCHGHYSVHFLSHVMGWGKLVIVISEIIGRHMIDRFGVHPDHIRLIPRSVDLERFTFRPRRTGQSHFNVMMIGRITPLKGHPDFLRAMAKAMRQMPYIRVKVIGDAPASKQAYKENLQLLVRRLGISDKVEFCGNCNDIPGALREADALVLATVTQEAFGRVIIEAQASGVPVVATKVGGVVDIVEHEKTGLLVLPGDHDAMAAAVLRLAKEPKLVDAITREGRSRVERKYTLDQMVTKTVGVYEELRRSLNVLVIKLSATGDIILAAASFKALREKYPEARISCLVGREGAVLLEGCPYLDEVIIYDYKGKDAGVPGFLSLLQKLRHYRFDKIIDLQNNMRSHLLTFLCFPRAAYGYRNHKLGFLLNHGIMDDQPKLSPIRHQFRVLEGLGIKYDENKTRLEFWPRPADFDYARQLLNSEWIDDRSHPIVGINIAASERWGTKNWPIRHTAKLCDMLAANGVRVVITGMDKDRDFVRELLKTAKSKPAVFTGKTNILQLAALISLCRCFITADSAPLHLAAAMGVPVVALFGPTDPARHAPPADQILIVQKKLVCIACYKTQCLTKKNACMEEITPDEIFKAVNQFLTIKTG